MKQGPGADGVSDNGKCYQSRSQNRHLGVDVLRLLSLEENILPTGVKDHLDRMSLAVKLERENVIGDFREEFTLALHSPRSTNDRLHGEQSLPGQARRSGLHTFPVPWGGLALPCVLPMERGGSWLYGVNPPIRSE